jgi:two-component system, NtrC family, sensor histidine kinase KinB
MEKGWSVDDAFESIRQRLKMLETLEEAQGRLASETDPDAILERLAETAARIIKAETLAVTMLSEDRRTLRYEYTYGKHAADLLGAVFPIENAGLCGWVLENRKPILSVNLMDDPRVLKESAAAFGIHTAVLAPLIAKGMIIGGLSAFNKTDGSKFNEDDLSMLSQLAGYAALAVVNARLMRDLTGQKAKMEVILDNMEDGFLFITCDGAISEANRSVHTLSLTKQENLAGRNIKDIDPSDPIHDALAWDIGAGPGKHCWEFFACKDESCPAYRSDILRCWTLSSGHCRTIGPEAAGSKEKLWGMCLECNVMEAASVQLAKPRELVIGKRTLSVASTIISEDGTLMLFGELFVFHDVTAEKDLERQRTEFMSMLSHDLKSPITSIMGYSEMIAQESDMATARELNSFVTSNTGRLLRMINNLLDYTRAESGRLKMDRHAISPASALGITLATLVPLAGAKGINLVWEAQEGTPDVYADIDLFSRIISNLVNNAIAKVKDGGNISVRAVPGPEGFVEFSVKDDGPGIKPEYIERIFEKFYSPEGPAKGGTGLGLYIVKALTEMQGGRVGVESSEGTGATFRVLLPVADGAGVTAA